MSQVLVILGPTGATRDEVVRRGSVAHQVSQRVFVLDSDEPGLSELAGVESVFTGAESEFELPDDLSPAESVFAKGWMERQAKRGTRAGDGLDWDAPGFQAPDPPDRR
jgi:hypothetical protein